MKSKINTKHKLSLAKNREILLVIFIVILCIVVQSRNSAFLSLANVMDILKDSSMLIILSIGMMMVVITRGIDISIASIMAFTCVAVNSIMVNSYSDMPAAIAIVIGAVMGLGFGLINGLLIAKGKVLPIIATMGTMNIIRGFAVIVCNSKAICAVDMNEEYKSIATGSIFGINNLIIIAFVIFIIFYVFLNHFKVGKRIYAVGSNPHSAKIAGINPDNIILLVYIIMGILSGICGVLWGSRYAYANADSCMSYEMQVIPAVVLGGTNIVGGSGKIQGVLLGAILFGAITNTLPMLLISNFWKVAIQGAIILAAIIINAVIMRQSNKRNLAMRRG